MSNSVEELHRIVTAAFSEERPSASSLLQPRYAASEDAGELRDALAGRSWRHLSLLELFQHREMLIALSGVGYQAYLPAYLCAALTNDERLGGDLRFYLINSLSPLSDSESHIATAQERLSRLMATQRSAVADVLHYLAETLASQEAPLLLDHWH